MYFGTFRFDVQRKGPQGWSQIGIHSKFVRFDWKICDSIYSKGQKIFVKFDEN